MSLLSLFIVQLDWNPLQVGRIAGKTPSPDTGIHPELAYRDSHFSRLMNLRVCPETFCDGCGATSKKDAQRFPAGLNGLAFKMLPFTFRTSRVKNTKEF